ncbi:MAG: FliI/YscN family ATPase [Phycisphaerae bacterium]|nr:FliI/YscN family ATPase [Phycisphaerae bacterium]
MSLLQLDTFRSRLDEMHLMPCRGRVVRVSGLTIESQGPPVGMGELCDIHLLSGRVITAEVVGFHDQHRVLMPLEGIEGVSPSDTVVARKTPRTIRVGEALLGRVLDGLGRPIDGKGPILSGETRRLDNVSPAPLARQRITEPLCLGVRSMDGLSTVGKGQRMGIFAGSGVGKSVLLGEIARNTSADVNVLALVGERGREVREFIEECLGAEGLARSVVCVATSDASPIQRVKVAFQAVAIAEYFRDQGRDVLMMMDSITRFAHAQREIGLAAGEPPTTKGYCPSVYSLLPKLVERMGRSDKGTITGMITVLVDGDDLSDPVADCVRSLLDGHVVLDRKLAEKGHYPAVDILQSVSRLMNVVATPEHQLAARRCKAIYATYHDAEDLINIGAYVPGANRRIDLAVELIEQVRAFLVQESGDPASSVDETANRLVQITQSWDAAPATLPVVPTATASQKPKASPKAAPRAASRAAPQKTALRKG